MERYLIIDYHKYRYNDKRDNKTFYDEFWNSDEPHEFRVHQTAYADKYKFREYINKVLEEIKSNLYKF